MRRVCRWAQWLAAVVICLLVPARLLADIPSRPLPVTNLSPLVANRLLPVQRHAAVHVGLDIAFDSQLASHFVDRQAGSEALFLDGESYDLVLDMRYGLSDQLDVSVRLPWRLQRRGFLDGVINDWHGFFGLPDGGRSSAPKDVLDYRYQRHYTRGRYQARHGAHVGNHVDSSDPVSFEQSEPASAVGDVQLAAQWMLRSDPARTLAVAVGAELSTGDTSELSGSGGDEAFVALRFSGVPATSLPLVWHGQVGMSWADDVAPLGDFAARDLWFAGLSVDWRLTDRWSLQAQLDGHAAPFTSDLSSLGEPALQLSLGARWEWPSRWALTVGFSEDIAVATAPDIVFFSSLRYTPGN